MNGTDTIAAIATPPGRGGVGVVRVSGPELSSFMGPLFHQELIPRYAHFSPFYDHDGSILDSGLALYFQSPASFTGEDVLELQAHGSPVVLDLLLRRVLSLGARLAKPGEFSERAFLNGKIDLAQAEAIADLIASSTEQSARSAQRSLQGEFSKHIDSLLEVLIQLRQYVESAIDFVDEEIDFLSQGQVKARIDKLLDHLDELEKAARQGSVLRNGMTLVIAGPPNVGKSSLLNRLSGYETAIVSPIPGTTRDSLKEHIQIDGLPLHIIDTAGLRHSQDPIEMEGVKRARQAIGKADRVLLVVDDRHPEEGQHALENLPEGVPVTRIHNKIDLTGNLPEIVHSGNDARVSLSLLSGNGLDLLLTHLKCSMNYESEAQDVFMARRRHLDALGRASSALASARLSLGHRDTFLELLAEDLRQAQMSLAEVTGRFTTEDLLDRIFSEFCIGK